MTPLALTDQQLKTVLDVAGFVPRRLRRKLLKDIAAQLPVVPGDKIRFYKRGSLNVRSAP